MPAIADALDIFAANLRRARLAAGLSQEALAQRADLNLGHVSRIERSEREPGVRSVAKLAQALGISASVLFEGIDGHDRRTARRS
jgi:transcriptional regulator with XRE-family HTH domain